MEEGVALGKPKDGEGNLESETDEGKPLMCSLSTGEKKWLKLRLWQNNGQFYRLQKCTCNRATGKSHIPT